MLVKFQTIKQDIKQGMDLEYFFTYYKYEVGGCLEDITNSQVNKK